MVKPLEPIPAPPPKFVTKDSGQRELHDTGAQRDIRQGKGRFDLLPPIVIRRYAELLERGASKYGSKEECDLEGVNTWLRKQQTTLLATQIVLFTPMDFVGVATKNSSEQEIQSMYKGNEPIVLSGENVTKLKLNNTTEKDTKIPCYVLGTRQPRGVTTSCLLDSMKPSSASFELFKKTAAPFVVEVLTPLVPSTSITITQPDTFEVYYVVAATTVSACLEKALNFYVQRSNILISRRPNISICSPEKVALETNGDHNWEKGMPLSRYADSALRHLFQLLAGDTDEDHAAAVIFNIGAIIHHRDAISKGLLSAELDDLPKNKE